MWSCRVFVFMFFLRCKESMSSPMTTVICVGMVVSLCCLFCSGEERCGGGRTVAEKSGRTIVVGVQGWEGASGSLQRREVCTEMGDVLGVWHGRVQGSCLHRVGRIAW